MRFKSFEAHVWILGAVCAAGTVAYAAITPGRGGSAGSGGPPSGPAGGDLAGTYPNPTLAVDRVRRAGDTVTGVLQFSSAGSAAAPTVRFQSPTETLGFFIEGVTTAFPVVVLQTNSNNNANVRAIRFGDGRIQTGQTGSAGFPALQMGTGTGLFGTTSVGIAVGSSSRLNVTSGAGSFTFPTAAPTFNGQVLRSTTAGVMSFAGGVNAARINNNGTCSVGSQSSNNFISAISRPGTGKCTLTFAANAFSDAPHCTCTSLVQDFASRFCQIDPDSTISATTITIGTKNTAANFIDNDMMILCVRN